MEDGGYVRCILIHVVMKDVENEVCVLRMMIEIKNDNEE